MTWLANWTLCAVLVIPTEHNKKLKHHLVITKGRNDGITWLSWNPPPPCTSSSRHSDTGWWHHSPQRRLGQHSVKKDRSSLWLRLEYLSIKNHILLKSTFELFLQVGAICDRPSATTTFLLLNCRQSFQWNSHNQVLPRSPRRDINTCNTLDTLFKLVFWTVLSIISVGWRWKHIINVNVQIKIVRNQPAIDFLSVLTTFRKLLC